MKKLIHPGFFREIFRQLRAKGLVATFILAGLNLVFFSIYLTRDPVTASIGHFDARLMAAPMLIMLYVFVPIMTFGAYRWLNRRVESDFYHAIPLTRAQIYATTTAAIFLWLLIALGSYAVVHAILRTAFGLPINYLLFLCVFVNMLIAMIEIVAAFSIGLSLCGRGFTAFFQSIAVLFLPRVLLTAFWILTEVDSGFTLPFSMILPFFNPEYNIAATPLHSLIYGINYANPLAMLYSLVMSTGLLVLGGVAFHKRKSELAEMPYASKVLQTVTRVMFGMPQLLSVTVILNVWMRYGWEEEEFMPREILIPLVLTSVLFSFIFYCLYELISSRKMKKVVKAMPGYMLCLALSAFFIFVPFWIGKARTLTPIAAEEIKSFKISNESTILIPSNVSGSETWTDYVLYRHTFSDTHASALIALQSKEDSSEQQKGDEVNFTDMQRIIVNKGGLFKKMVNLPSYSGMLKTKDKLLRICKNDAAFKDELVAYPKGQITYYASGLTLQEARTVGRLFREDYEKLSDEERLSLFISNSAMIEVNDASASPVGLRIALYGSYGTDNYTMEYSVNELTPNAAKAMLGFLNARNAENARKELKALVDWMEHPIDGVAFDQFNVGTRSFSQWNLWNYEDQRKFATPKDAHPDEYKLLKALSEAPTTDDPSHCVTFSIVSYDYSSITTTTSRTTAGIAVDDTLRAYIEQWVASDELTEEFPFDVLDM